MELTEILDNIKYMYNNIQYLEEQLALYTHIHLSEKLPIATNSA